MRTQLLLSCIALFSFSSSVFAASEPARSIYAPSAGRPSGSNRSGDVGLGIMVGEPTGLTLKSWLSPKKAFDIGLTYSFNEFFEVLGDYLWHFPTAFSNREFVPYIGLGGEVFFDASNESRLKRTVRDTSNAGFGMRIPLGIEFLPHNVPIGVFAELAPGVALAPSVVAFLEGGLGVRLYF